MFSHQSKWFSIATADQSSALSVERINEAIAEVIFSQDAAGLPVYLDINDQESDAICELLEIESSRFKEYLCNAVSSIPRTKGWKKIFSEFEGAAGKWVKAQTPMEVPPTLALLALLCMAAEEMAAGTDISGANYYERLSFLLGCEGEETELGNQYRDRAIELWSSLQEWLGAWDGERGLSTVPIPKNLNKSSRDFKWAVQMPISQARLRDADRQDLHRMFNHYRLEPGSNISIETMSIFLEDWCTSPYSTRNIQKIWKIDDYRETLASAAISELHMWTGRPAGEQGFGIRLLVSFNKTLRLGRKFIVNIELRCNPTVETKQVSVDIGPNNSQVCDVFKVAKGQFRLVDAGLFEPGSLVSRPLKMSIGASDIKGERKPRQVIPMRLNEQQLYVEVDALSLEGVFGVLMLAEVPGGIKLREQCEEILTEIARPGWSVVSPDDVGVHGLPNGWLFIQNIEVMTVRTSAKPVYSALNALLPQAMPSLQLSRGLRIPGQQDRWLISHIPELKVIYPADEAISIRLVDNHEKIVKEFILDQRAGIISLSDLGLTPGRYHITMSLSDGTVIGRKMLTLVGADTPNAWSALKQVSFCYVIGDPSLPSAMTSVHASTVSSGDTLRGFYFEGTAPIAGVEMEPPISAPWNEQFVIESAKDDIKRNQVSIKTEDRGACFYTGMHYFAIEEVAYPHRLPKGAVLHMRCRTCGISKTQSARPIYKWNIKTTSTQGKRPPADLQPLNFASISPIPIQVSGKWDLVYEAMCYLRHGKLSDIETLTSQLVGEEDFNVERFTHGLQILGLIDLSLDAYFRVEEWSVSPACAVMASGTSGFLSGFRSADLLKKIENGITLVGGSLKQIENKDLPCSWIFEVPNPDAIRQSFNGILDPITKAQISVARDIAVTIARGVGSISQLFDSSPEVRIPPYVQLKIWDRIQTKWVDADDPRVAGALQYVGYGNKYSYSDTAIDIDGFVISGSVRTVKLKIAQSFNSPLAYYDATARQFYVRLGAELPGLFGRAMVAASGLAPREDLRQRVVVYSGIEPILARLIFGQLMS